MPPVPRRVVALQSLVGTAVSSRILLHFLRLSRSDVGRAADAYFQWREANPNQNQPDEMTSEEETEEGEKDQTEKKTNKRSRKVADSDDIQAPMSTSKKDKKKSPTTTSRAKRIRSDSIAPSSPSASVTSSPPHSAACASAAASSPIVSPVTTPTLTPLSTPLSSTPIDSSAAAARSPRVATSARRANRTNGEANKRMTVTASTIDTRPSDEETKVTNGSDDTPMHSTDSMDTRPLSDRKRKDIEPTLHDTSNGVQADPDERDSKRIKVDQSDPSLAPPLSPSQPPSKSAPLASPARIPLVASYPTSPIVAPSVAPSLRSPATTPSTMRSPHTRKPHPTPLPLPMPSDEDEDEENDSLMADTSAPTFESVVNLSAAFASAASSSEVSFKTAAGGSVPIGSNAATSRHTAAASLHGPRSRPISGGGFGDAKPFKPPRASVGASTSLPASSDSPSPSCSPPSQEFVDQKVRNRGKYSSLDALISDLESDVAKSGVEVEPDITIGAVNQTIGVRTNNGSETQSTFASASTPTIAPSAAAAANVPALASSSSPPASSSKRIRFTTSNQLEQHLLTLMRQQCCVPTTAHHLATVLNGEYEVTQNAIQAQLDRLAEAGKLDCTDITIRHKHGSGSDKVDIVWLQPMGPPPLKPLKTINKSEPEPTSAVNTTIVGVGDVATSVSPSMSSRVSAALTATPISSTPSKSSPSASSSPPESNIGAAATPTPLSDTKVGVSTPTNHLSKTSSALKARLSKSRARPTLLTVGGGGNEDSAAARYTTPSKSTPPAPPSPSSTKSTAVPWTALAAAAASSSSAAAAGDQPTTSSTLTPDQQRMIQLKKDAALSKRKALLAPRSLVSAAQSPLDQLHAELRSKQSQLVKLRNQKFIHVDPKNTEKIEGLVEKWTVTAQEVLNELLEKLQQTRAVSMDSLLRDFGVNPKQVRWNEITSEFE